MSNRERRAEERTSPPATGANDERPADSGAKDAGDAFLRAADAALDRALSSTPEDFLRQNRQLGGQ